VLGGAVADGAVVATLTVVVETGLTVIEATTRGLS
jgi:hypothetical protein